MPNKSCAFYSCKSNSRKDPTLKWTRFVSPYNDLERYKIWFEKLKRPSYDVTRNTYVCEKHFPQGTDLNKLTNLELVPEAESNPEECGIKPIKPEPRKKIDKVIVLPKRTRGNQLKVPKLHYKETLEITEPREPTIGELMKLEFKKQISGISTPNSKKSKSEVQKLTLWRCECDAIYHTKKEIINHIRQFHNDKVINSFDLHNYGDSILFHVNLSKKVQHEIVIVNQDQLSEDTADHGLNLVLETSILLGNIKEDDTDPLSDSKRKTEVIESVLSDDLKLEDEDPLRI